MVRSAPTAAIFLLSALVALACGAPVDTRPTATGTLVYEPSAAEGSDRAAFLATQAEIARSDTIARSVAEWLGDPDPDAPITATVRAEADPDAWIVRVSVLDADPVRAAERCNATLQAVAEARFAMQHAARQEEIQALAAQRDRAAGDEAKTAELRARIDELELASITYRTDVRILDRCR